MQGAGVGARGTIFNLSGTVKHQGLPVAATTIVLFDYWSDGASLVRHELARQVTTQSGEFSFAVRKGIYRLEIVPNPDTRFVRQQIETVKVDGNVTMPINLTSGNIIAGRALKGAGDTPVNCQLILLAAEGRGLVIVEPVTANGTFSLAVPRGTYLVAFRAGTAGAVKNEAFLCPSTQTLEVQRDISDLVLRLPEMVQFKGAVTNERGHPVADVKVTIKPSESETGSSHLHNDCVQAVCSTSKIGQFECQVEPGLYDVKLEPPPDSHLCERLFTSILVDQARTRTLALSAGYKLFGRVSLNDQPVKDCLVTVSGGKLVSSALSDANGRYALSIPGGAYELAAVAQPDSLAQAALHVAAPFHCSVFVTEDTQQDISLQEGSLLAGKVVERSGRACPGVQVSLYKHAGKVLDTTSGAQRPIAFSICGDDGTYEFRLAPGKYWVLINNQQSTARLVESAAGQDIECDLLWEEGCLVDFEVVSEFEKPVPGCHVQCELYGAAAEGQAVSAVSNEAGICRFAIASGIYVFHFQPPNGNSLQAKTIRQLSINSDIRRKVRLPSS